ncbi:MAG: SOS response-associated peptidase family protein [Betaproteobacteria bacterium]|nr:SOS response-associated peptidase family protein [Betaproteobacteria bacterium]
MCTRYISPEQREIEYAWTVSNRKPLRWWSDPSGAAEAPPAGESEADAGDIEALVEKDVFPAQLGALIKVERHPKLGKHFALVAGQFGLIAHWVRPDGVKKMTRACYNARTETVHEKPSYRTAWKQMNWCVIPAKAIYEPCYESGRPVPWKIRRADGKPLWIAGIRWAYKLPDGKFLETYSMLTINADDHALFRRMHAPDDEKRIVVMLRDEDVEAWLNAATHDEARSFFTQYPAEALVAEAAADAPRVRRVAAKGVVKAKVEKPPKPEGPAQLELGEG